MNRQPVIVQLPDPEYRDLVISDIHGNLEVFKKLLHTAGYNPERDRLILLGDLCEKGPDSLKTVRWIMQLKKAYPGQVFAIMGNCDFIAKNSLYSYRLEFLRQVLLSRKESLLHEMSREIGLDECDADTDMEEYCQILRRHFLEELSFLNDLPHVIETPSRIYAHAGIESEDNFGTDFRQIMVRFQFAFEDAHFRKDVVCGHMPVTEYCRKYADFNPHFDMVKHIISIDGGNIVKKAGQLNAVAFYQNKAETWSEDLLPEAKAIRTTRPANLAPYFVNWNQGMVRVQNSQTNQVLVHSDWLHRSFWIPVWALHHGKASDFTNYQIPLNAGDRVKVVSVHKNRVLIKRRGILGWTEKENLKMTSDLQQLKQ